MRDYCQYPLLGIIIIVIIIITIIIMHFSLSSNGQLSLDFLGTVMKMSLKKNLVNYFAAQINVSSSKEPCTLADIARKGDMVGSLYMNCWKE